MPQNNETYTRVSGQVQAIRLGQDDLGQGGADGFSHTITRWCVIYEDKKLHVSKEIVDGKVSVDVRFCDGSCCENLPILVEMRVAEFVRSLSDFL